MSEDMYSEMGYELHDDRGAVQFRGISYKKREESREVEEDDYDTGYDDVEDIEIVLDKLGDLGYDTYDEDSVIEGLKEELGYRKSEINRFMDDWMDYIENN